ncbi:hypothetical protein [Agarilytica rhodophyticola]|uniref:hypothetical protein n=1 Tax=Agarilytica rhodophyticola TaxID=1737490 RepID=UPI000B343813|nr:hypothetical protein [Agarilytica rhodophyticola]
MKKLSAIVCLALFLSTFQARAAWHDAGKVTCVHSGHGNGPFAFSTEVNINIEGCSQKNFGYFVNETNSAAERMYSLILAAYMSGKSIAIATTGQCISNRPEVDAVQFKDTTYF